MSKYTEADVEQWEKGIRKNLADGVAGAVGLMHLQHLKAAALEGAKVPGLVEHSRNQERRCEDLARQCREAESQVSALQARVAELEQQVTELNANTARLVAKRETDAAGKAALQARVKELENDSKISARRGAQHVRHLEAQVAKLKARLPDGMKKGAILFKSCLLGHRWLTATNCVKHGCPHCAKRVVESERDALRARVTQAVAIASGVSNRMPDDVAGVVCRDILTALSAPPAETTPAPERTEGPCRGCGEPMAEHCAGGSASSCPGHW